MKKSFGIRFRVVAATPMICLIVYLAVGFIWNIWSPTWTIFFLIPIMPILLGTKKITQIVTYPLICVAIFLTLGFVWSYWHPGWLVFLTIPVYYTIIPHGLNNKKEKKEKIIDFTK